jgi:hypothetical protein
MSKLKFPEAGLIATLARSIMSNTDHDRMGEPCYSVSEEGCNTSTVRAWYTLQSAGFVTPGYHGKKCPHGYPTSGGALAYIYDNYVERALRFPCELAVKQMLSGTVALLLFKNIRGTGGKSHLDLWITDKCTLMSSFEEGAAEEIWIWPLGKFNYHSFGKSSRRHKRAAQPVIF